MRLLGALAARAGDADAEQLLRSSLALDPDDFYARTNLAKLLELRDDYESRMHADRSDLLREYGIAKSTLSAKSCHH